MARSTTLNVAGIIEVLKRKISSLQQQWRSTRRENERLRKENEALRQERERLRSQLDKLKRQLLSEPTNDKRLLFPVVSERSILSDQGESAARPTASVITKPFRNKWMK